MDSWIILGVFCVVGLHSALVLACILVHLESKETQARIELLRLQLLKAGMLYE